MAAYIYPIKINYEKQKIQISHKALLPDQAINIEQLQEIVGHNTFCFVADDSNFTQDIFVCWNSYRDETDEEQMSRIEKEKAYMKEYEKRQKKD